MELILTFERTIDAMRAEQALSDAQLRPLVMPLPSQIRAGCGICLRIDPAHHRRALDALSKETLHHAGLYLRRVENSLSQYQPFEEDSL